MRLLPALGIPVLGLMATGVSSLIPRTATVRHSEIMGCESGCRVAAGGWPLPYLVDYPAISPVGSVSLTEGLLGIDHIQTLPLSLDLVFWMLIAAVIILPLHRGRSAR